MQWLERRFELEMKRVGDDPRAHDTLYVRPMFQVITPRWTELVGTTMWESASASAARWPTPLPTHLLDLEED